MPQANVVMNVRQVSPIASVIDIQGEVTAFAEKVLMEAYAEASTPTTRSIILNFSELEYMNSSGIGLIVTLQPVEKGPNCGQITLTQQTSVSVQSFRRVWFNPFQAPMRYNARESPNRSVSN